MHRRTIMSQNVATEIKKTPTHSKIDTGITFCGDRSSLITYCAGCVQVTYELIQSSAKNISVRVEWLRQTGRAPSEPSETPWWRVTPLPASIPRLALHIALQSLFHRFFLLCRSPILNERSGVVANCDHTSEWVHWVRACIGIAM
jgi:hypothetical protein